jgi:hypothetical protein
MRPTRPRRWRRSWQFLTVAAMCLAVAAASSVETAHGTREKGRCGAGQVAVTVNGHASCRPTGTVLPKPKATDATLAVLRDALRSSPFTRFGAGGKQAQRRIIAALPHMLALIAAHTKKGPRRSVASVHARTAPCPSGPDVASANLGGLQFGGSDGAGHAQVGIGGNTYTYSWEECGSDALSVPDCPSANGDVRASSGSKTKTLNIGQEVRQGGSSGQVLTRRRDSWTSKSTANGKVADDARLDSVDFTYSMERFVLQTTYGQAPLVERGTEVRRVRINMRSGSYDSANSSVSIQGDAGPFAGNAEASRFAEAVARAISSFRRAEARWSSFQPGEGGFCAKAIFTPSSNTHRLKAGESGTVAIYAKARDGGRATGARWTLIGPANATFSPSSARAPSPRVTYRVAGSPSGNRVQVTAKFTSTAGAGKDTWTQPLDTLPTRFEGSFSGQNQVAATNSFSGKITFVRDQALSKGGVSVYAAESVDFNVSLSGTSPCTINATAHVTLGKSNLQAARLIVETTKTANGYRYAIAAGFQDTHSMPIQATCNGVQSTIPWTPGGALYTSSDTFADDLHELKGTYDSPATQAKYSWDLKGS